MLVVDEFLDRGVIAADRALGILAQLQFAEAHAERIDQQQAADERVAFAQNELDDLSGLDDADQAGQNAQHAAFSATRHQAGRRRLRIEAAVAGAVLGREDAGLAFKAEDRAVRIRLAQQYAGIVDQVARGKVVGAVGDDVVVLENFERVGAGEHRLVLDDVQRGIERDELFRGGVELLAPDVFGRVNDLALQIAGVHDVEVDQPQRANARCGQIKSQRRAQPAGAHAEHTRGFQLALALHAHLGQNQVARVAGEIVGGQFGKVKSVR